MSKDMGTGDAQLIENATGFRRKALQCHLLRQQIGRLIDELSKTTTIVFTDQSVHFALKHAQRAFILERGKVVHEATSDDLRNDHETQERYLSVA